MTAFMAAELAYWAHEEDRAGCALVAHWPGRDVKEYGYCRVGDAYSTHNVERVLASRTGVEPVSPP